MKDDVTPELESNDMRTQRARIDEDDDLDDDENLRYRR